MFQLPPYPETLRWLQKSIDANQGKGSSAYFSITHRFWRRGWERAYPETTGYIIETLLDYYQYYSEGWLRAYALSCADWICTLQMPDGALPAGVVGSKKASIFNTGQMLFGLTRAYQETNDERYKLVAQSAVNWLCNNLEADGSWQKGAYVEGYIPSYYTRVIWAVLLTNNILKDEHVSKKMQHALAYYIPKVMPNGAVKNWAFAPHQAAFTHTIAYTMRGFLESSQLLKDGNNSLQSALKIAYGLVHQFEKHQKIAGTYDENWNGDYTFTCITGNAQLSLNFYRFYEITKDSYFLKYANIFFETICNEPKKSRILLNKNGAIAGSKPIGAKYMAWKYPNWAAKFYLDAWLKNTLHNYATN